jgi:hypothetical protein
MLIPNQSLWIDVVFLQAHPRVCRRVYPAKGFIPVFEVAGDGNHGGVVGGVAKLGDE